MHVVQECEEMLLFSHGALSLRQSTINPQTEEEHQKILLFPSLALHDVMLVSGIIPPSVVRWLRIHGLDDREETMQSLFGEQLGQHGATEHVVNAVAVRLASVNARMTCPAQSVPALVERVNRKGAHARSPC